MIGKLSGTIDTLTEKTLILDVNGVGYELFVRTGALLGYSRGQNISLFTHLNVRETALELYGFEDINEKKFFDLIIGISGIGPKGALGVLDIAPLPTLVGAIAAGDPSYLTKVSGVGKKTAQKIVLELKDKIEKLGITGDNQKMQDDADALEALIAIGYSLTQAREALKQIPEEIENTNDKIREALKNLS